MKNSKILGLSTLSKLLLFIACLLPASPAWATQTEASLQPIPTGGYSFPSEGYFSDGTAALNAIKATNYLYHSGETGPTDTGTGSDAPYGYFKFNSTGERRIYFKLEYPTTLTLHFTTKTDNLKIYSKSDNSVLYTMANTSDHSTITVSDALSLAAGDYYIDGNSANERIYKLEFAATLGPITDNFFWYYNGGEGFGSDGLHYSHLQYRYFPNSYPTYSTGKTVLINGTVVGGNNGNAANSDVFGSYVFDSTAAIGVRLANDRAYCVKIYYNSDGSAAGLYKNDDATSTTSAVAVTGGITTEIKDSDGGATTTRLITYDIPAGNGGVYWVKSSAATMYLGGFEVLPVAWTSAPDTKFTAASWYVEDNYDSTTNSISGTQIIQLAKSANNVVVTGTPLPISAITDGGKKTVMLSNRSKIGVYLPANSTISFSYTADSGVQLVITNEDGSSTLATPTGSAPFYKVTYTSPTAQKVWITGASTAYAYFPGFTLTRDVLPISFDYIWYPVADKFFAADALTDDYTKNIGSAITANGSTITRNYQSDKPTYQFADGNILKFTIAAGTKGVINFFMSGWSMRLYDSQANAESNGDAIGLSTSSIDGAQVSSYYFDLTSATEDKTFYLSPDKDSSDGFGGFEVLFDKGISYVRSFSSDSDKFDNGTYKTTFTNAIGEDKYSAIANSASVTLYGPTIMCSPIWSNTIMLRTLGGAMRDALLFKMTNVNFKSLSVTAYLRDGASIKIYKNSSSAALDTSTATLVHTITGSGQVSEQFNIDSYSADDIFWVMSDAEKGAYLKYISPSYTEIATSLVEIEDHHLYKVANTPSDGDLLSTAHVLYRGDGLSSASQMTVLGQKNNAVAMQSGKDFFGILVGDKAGTMTGHIKVYFNGGSSGNHRLYELPLADGSLNAGYAASYADNIISFNTTSAYGAACGWWFGESTPFDITAYNKIDIELDPTFDNAPVQLAICTVGGGTYNVQLDSQGRLLGSFPTNTFSYTNWADEVVTYDPTQVTQIYLQYTGDGTDSRQVKIKSARIFNKPLEIDTGTDQTNTSASTRSEVFGGIINNVQDAYVYSYPFNLNLNNTSNPQLYWITGDINLAAIEVIYDDETNVKVVDWYVNKDTKLIVGSDDPNWVWTGFDGTSSITYPKGYDEYATFYISAGRQAHVSFIMPEAVREVYDWEQAVKDAGITGKTSVDESSCEAAKNSYGKHTITTEKISQSNSSITLEGKYTVTYNRNMQYANMSAVYSEGDDPIYNWYSRDYTIPHDNGFNKTDADCNHYEEVSVTATQMEDGSSSTVEYIDGKKGQWKICFRFVSYKAPVVSNNSDITENSAKAGENVTIASGHVSSQIYYTTDSSDPVDLDAGGINEDHSTTKRYSNGSTVAVKQNCIVTAAQYFSTPYQFYTDCNLGSASPVSNSLKLVSKDYKVVFDKSNVVYVKDTDKTDDELFNNQSGGYMLTLPTGDKIPDASPHEQYFNATPWMYLTLGGKNWPYYAGTNGFSLNGGDWQASEDSGLKTYLDSYQKKFDTKTCKNIAPWNTSDNQNNNPYTECNGGPGGATTEDGGMFLQPLAGTCLRFEPEYDGVVTVWLRQNGCLDNSSQELGTFTRRPTYVMDENGRIMRRTTVKPTDVHHLGINGVYAINSSVAEERSQVEHTWLYGVAKQVYENHPIYGYRFNDASGFPNRWEKMTNEGYFEYMTNKGTSNDYRGGSIMYAWWYKGFDLVATRSTITSASHVSRYEYMEPELLYRSDNIYNMEIGTLGLRNGFAKYGFELPNFQYVRYSIPVKAGKTYYIAGRGTKNGFAAISFDPLKANTNGSADEINKHRYIDNPFLTENTDDTNSDEYLKPKYVWDATVDGRKNKAETAYSDSEITDSYNKSKNSAYKELTITQTNTNNYTNVIQPEIKYDLDGLGNLVGQTVDVKLDRTFTKDYWHPIILPFSLSETRVEQYFGEGTRVLYLDPYKHTLHNQKDDATNTSWISAISPALEHSKLCFTYHRYQMLYANTPAFICPTFTWSDKKKSPATNNVHPTPNANNEVSDITFKRVTLDGSNASNNLGDGYFGYAISPDYEVVGSYDQHVLTGDCYYITNNTNEAQLVHATGKANQKVTMRGTRAWIRPIVAGRSCPPILSVGSKNFSDLFVDGDAAESGISDIVADDAVVEMFNDNGVYDLLGRKLGEGSLEGLPAGVYIFQGRKVYIR